MAQDVADFVGGELHMELVNRDDVSVVITCQGTGGGANGRRGWRRKAAPTRAGRWRGAGWKPFMIQGKPEWEEKS
jgi:hypothetical protein